MDGKINGYPHGIWIPPSLRIVDEQDLRRRRRNYRRSAAIAPTGLKPLFEILHAIALREADGVGRRRAADEHAQAK
jgi:hypothetical protein